MDLIVDNTLIIQYTDQLWQIKSSDTQISIIRLTEIIRQRNTIYWLLVLFIFIRLENLFFSSSSTDISSSLINEKKPRKTKNTDRTFSHNDTDHQLNWGNTFPLFYLVFKVEFLRKQMKNRVLHWNMFCASNFSIFRFIMRRQSKKKK